MKKKFVLVWSQPYYKPKTKIVDSSFFTGDNGYNEDEIDYITTTLDVAEMYTILGHTIIRMHNEPN